MLEGSGVNEGDITITITECQHELLIDILNHAMDAMHLVMPYSDGLYDLPNESHIVQRHEMINNMRNMLQELWSDRFNDMPLSKLSQGHVRKDMDAL
jgi:hypothetical protein